MDDQFKLQTVCQQRDYKVRCFRIVVVEKAPNIHWEPILSFTEGWSRGFGKSILILYDLSDVYIIDISLYVFLCLQFNIMEGNNYSLFIPI